MFYPVIGNLKKTLSRFKTAFLRLFGAGKAPASPHYETNNYD